MVTIPKRRMVVAGALTVLLIVGVSAALLIAPRTDPAVRFTKEASRIMEVCSAEGYKPACYDTEIPKVMDRGFSFEDAFAITKIIQERDQSYWYCHVLGHNLSAKEASKDVSQWTSVVARCPTGVCSNGCLHGAFQERFRGEYVSEDELRELIPEVQDICEPGRGKRNFTGLEQASCYHALGHLTMYITNADIEQSLRLCDMVSIKGEAGERDFSNLCYDGAYMQIFQPLEPEDIALVRDVAPTTRDEVAPYCEQFSGTRRTSCFMESWPLFVDEFDKRVGAIEAFCDRGFSARDETRCLNGVFYVLAARSNFDETQIERICSFVSDARKAQCYANSASRFLETDQRLAQKAVDVCEQARRAGVGDTCYQELLFYSAYNYHAGSDMFWRLCRAMPSPWRERCEANDGTTTKAPFYDE